MIITIDGPVATGKSTIAKKLAESIGYIFFDTGAMYRTVTYGILKYGIDLDNPEQLNEFLKNFKIDIKVVHRDRHYYFENEDITQKIRGEEVTSYPKFQLKKRYGTNSFYPTRISRRGKCRF